MSGNGRNNHERRRRFDERRAIESRVARASDVDLQVMRAETAGNVARAAAVAIPGTVQGFLSLAQEHGNERGARGRFTGRIAPTGPSALVRGAARMSPIGWGASALGTYVAATEGRNPGVIDTEIARRERENLLDRIERNGFAAPEAAPRPSLRPDRGDQQDAGLSSGVRIRLGRRGLSGNRVQFR